MACEKVNNVCACTDCKCEGCDCKSTVESVTAAVQEKCCVTEKQLSPEIEAKLETLLSIGEECIARDELASLLEKKPNFIAYDGFEPSGRMHIAQGILKAINVNKITSCGGTFVFWVADWFALLNNKSVMDSENLMRNNWPGLVSNCLNTLYVFIKSGCFLG